MINDRRPRWAGQPRVGGTLEESMRTHGFRIAIVVGGMALLLGPIALAQEGNLLSNGSFEEGPKVSAKKGWLTLRGTAATALKGWIVSRGTVNYLLPSAEEGSAAHGKVCLDLYGGVKQTFATVKGKEYRVTLSLAAASGEGRERIGVEAAGQKTVFEANGGKNKNAPLAWSTNTWNFVARAKSTTLEIYSLSKKDNGPRLDNVSVVPANK